MSQGKKLPPNGTSEMDMNEQHLQLPLKSEETPSSSGRSRRTPRMLAFQQTDKQNNIVKSVSLFYLNVQIEAKIYQSDFWTSFICRVVYIMGADEDKQVGFVPISKIIPTQPSAQEEEKVTAGSKRGGNAAEKESTPHSYRSRDLVSSLEGLQSDQVYYLVYLRDKTQAEQNALEMELNDESPFQSGKSGSRHPSPRKKVMNYFKRQGIKIQDSFNKTTRQRGQKKPLYCPFVSCLRDFQETGNLKTHLRIHTGERPFSCPFDDCSKRFITKGHLKTHELIHTGAKPFTCEDCGKSYSRTGRLKIHKRTHLGEKPFVCDFQGCGKSFTEKGNLKTHQRIHNGEKPFMCGYADCGRSFTTHGHLSDHYRRHTGERPFKCEQCDQSFMRSSTLKIHLRRHTGEKPFVCETCGKNFAESGNLRTHKKIHVSCLPGTKINDKCFSSAAKIAIGTIDQHQKPARSMSSAKNAQPVLAADCAAEAQQPGVTSMFNKTQEEKDTVGSKRPRPKYLTMLLNKQTNKDVGGTATCTNNCIGDNIGKAENLQLEKQQMTFAAPQTYSLPGLQGGMSRFPSTASGAKIPIRVKNSGGAIVNSTPATQQVGTTTNPANHIFTNSSKSGSNQSGSLTHSDKSSNPSATAAGDKRRAKANVKEEKVTQKQQLRHISPPQGALKPIQADIPWKFPVSVERKQEDCQQDPEKAVSINLNAMFHEVIRTISRENSERMLMENPVEPTTPISHGFVVQMPSQQNLFYPSRGISHSYGNTRGDNSTKRTKLFTLQNSTSPVRMALDYSPDNSAANQNLNLQMSQYVLNQGVAQGGASGGSQSQQPLQIYCGATPAELIKKLVPMSGYSDAFNSNDRTPRSSMNQSYAAEKTTTGQQGQSQLTQQLRSESQQFEDQVSSSYFQQNSFHTATFQQETHTHGQEGSIEGSQKPQNEAEQMVKMDLSSMKKNFSLNSQFDLKNVADVGLTKTINSFQTSRINQVGPKLFQSLTPTEMFLLRTPEKNHMTSSIQKITQADQADQQLPQSMTKAYQSATFNSVGKMALTKLQQHQAQKNTESESCAPTTKNSDKDKNRGGLVVNTSSMVNNNDFSPNSKFQYQQDKSPGLQPTPLNNPFRAGVNYPQLNHDSYNFGFLSDNVFKKDGQPVVLLEKDGSTRNYNNNNQQVNTGFQLLANRKFSLSHNNASVLNSNSMDREKEVDAESSPPQRMSSRKPLAIQREETFASMSAAKESEHLMKGPRNMH